MSTENNQNQQGDGGKKDAKKFEENLALLAALMNPNTASQMLLKKRQTIPTNSLEAVLNEIVEEEETVLRDKFKADFKVIAKKVVAYNEFVKQKKDEMDKAILEKKKEMNKEFAGLYNQINSVEILRANTKAAIKELVSGTVDENNGSNESPEPGTSSE